MSPVTPSELDRLQALARQRALALRAEAVDDFWRGADAVWAATLERAGRSARRLAHRLARHERRRAGAQPPAHVPGEGG